MWQFVIVFTKESGGGERAMNGESGQENNVAGDEEANQITTWDSLFLSSFDDSLAAEAAAKTLAAREGFQLHRSPKSPTNITLKCQCAGHPAAAPEQLDALGAPIPSNTKQRSGAGSAQCGCTWRIRLSKGKTNVWALSRFNTEEESFTHTHALPVEKFVKRQARKNAAEVLGAIGVEFFTDEKREEISKLAQDTTQTGVNFVQLVLAKYDLLDRKEKLTSDASRLILNIKSRADSSIQARAEDAKLFVAAGNELIQKGGFFTYKLGAFGVLKYAFFATALQVLWAKLYSQVVLQDNTFGTIFYHLATAIFVGVDGENKTRLLGIGVMTGEDAIAFEWLFMQFKAMVGFSPSVVFTDRAAAAIKALNIVFTDTVLLCCEWHLTKNIAENCHVSSDEYKELMNGFYAAARAETEDDFEKSWESLIVYVGSVSEKASTYLQSNIYTCKTMWAFCFRLAVLTLDIHSTQRIEGMIGVVKTVLHSKGTLMQLFNGTMGLVNKHEFADAYNTLIESEHNRISSTFHPMNARDPNSKAAPRVISDVRGQSIADNYLRQEVFSAVLTVCSEKTTGYAFSYTRREAQSSVYYQVSKPLQAASSGVTPFLTALQNTDVFKVSFAYEVTRINQPKKNIVVVSTAGAILCSCLEVARMGLHCRHSFAVMREAVAAMEEAYRSDSIKALASLFEQTIHCRWMKSTTQTSCTPSVQTHSHSIIAKAARDALINGHIVSGADQHRNLAVVDGLEDQAFQHEMEVQTATVVGMLQDQMKLYAKLTGPQRMVAKPVILSALNTISIQLEVLANRDGSQTIANPETQSAHKTRLLHKRRISGVEKGTRKKTT